MRRFLFRIFNSFRPDRAEHELQREMNAHLALLEDEYVRRGMTPEEARLAARRSMGSAAHTADLHRDARSMAWLDDLRCDFRLALRGIARSPAFALVAVLALGLGIGVNTAFFTIVNAICLRGLPIDSPERVLYVSSRNAQDRPGNLTYAEFDDLRARATAFSQVAAYSITTVTVADPRQPPARVSGSYISAGAFELIGHRPLLGRTFRADEDRPGTSAVVILGAELWSTRYASDSAIVGQSITVNGVPSTVIGVMPRGFMFPANADLWRPMANLPAAVRESRSERRLAVFARLAPGATADQARGDAAAIGGSWARDFPATNRDIRIHLVPINEQLNPTVYQRTWMAFVTAGVLVLLVACANVASLLLMRAATRTHEMAIRTSIGATRSRVIRQLLVESATLAVLASAAGVVIAWGALRVLTGIIPPEALPYWMAFSIDTRVLAVVMGVCLLCVFVCGLPSALHVSRVEVREALIESGTTTATRPTHRWIATLLAAEFAVTFVLLSVAVMSVRAEVKNTDFRIDPTSLVTLWMSLPPESYASTEARARFFDQLNERVGTSSAITSLALTSVLPYSGGPQQPVTVSGRMLVDAPPVVSVVVASEGYFETLGVPLVRGRAFMGGDGRPGNGAAIVNERFVQTILSDQNPIGARIRVGDGETPWLQIVGVATTVRQRPVGADDDAVVFLPFAADPPPTSIIVVRTKIQDPAEPIAFLRREVERIDPSLPLYRAMTFEQAMRNALWNARLSDVIIRSIAVVALLLALVGLYAVTAHTVERWTRELGLRIALGARAGQIGWLVLRRVLTRLSVGLVLGIVGALAFDRLFNDQTVQGSTAEQAARPEVGMTDPSALALIVLAITVIAVIACALPIRRATSLDPIETLRS